MMRGISRTVGVMLIALLIAAVFFLSLPGVTAWQRVLQDAGHGPVFAAIALVVLLMQRTGTAGPSVQMYWRAWLITMGLGAGSELVQHFQPGRSVSLLDVIHDAAGALLGLALFALIDRWRASPDRGRAEPSGTASPPTSLLVCLGLGALVLLAWEPLQCAKAYAERSRVFPVLLQGARPSDLYFTQARNGTLARAAVPERWLEPGDSDAVRLEHRSGHKAAIEIAEPAPDWRGHDSLLLDLVNPAARPLQLTLRILDAHHDWSDADRFNMPVVVPPTSRVVVHVALAAVAAAPSRRVMDMGDIRNVMLFARQPLPGTEFYVARVWLR
jgi:hypothetical protein